MGFGMFGERMELRSEVEIDREPGEVWDVLCALERYREWNPFLVGATGNIRTGARIQLVANFAGGHEEEWSRRVTKFEPTRRLAWSGRSGPLGLLSSEQFFELTATESGTTRLRAGDNVRGLLVRPTPSRLLLLSRAMALMNQALKRRVESAKP
jgi:hypothetical protein